MPVEQQLHNGIEMNPHGFGWALITENMQLLTGRSMDSVSALDGFLTARKQHPDGPALFHSRLSTGGCRTVDNCHPFTAGKDKRTVLAHNGTLFPAKWPRSDTREFAEDWFPEFFSDLDDSGTVKEMLATVKTNKLVILTVNPRYQHISYLVNGPLGFWVDSDGTEVPHPDGKPEGLAWHSNRDYLTPVLYRHEIPGKYWSRVLYTDRTQAACLVCEEPYAVNKVTSVCQVCMACADCCEQVWACACFQRAARVKIRK